MYFVNKAREGRTSIMKIKDGFVIVLTVFAFSVCLMQTNAAVIISISGSTADATPQDSTHPADGIGDGVFDLTKNALRVGAFATGTPSRRAAVFVFDLPVLSPGQDLGNVDFRARLFAKIGAPTYNVDLYAVRVGTSTDTVLASDYGAGPSPSGTLLQLNFLTPSSPNVMTSIDNTASALLGQFLKDNWVDGGRLFLRANANILDFSSNGTGGTIDQGYDFGSANHASFNDHPKLDLHFIIPEPSTTGLLMLGALVMFMRKRFHGSSFAKNGE